MASYAEIRTLFNDSGLKNRVATAVIVAANAILLDAAATAQQKSWANKAFQNPENEARRVFMAVLAANIGATVEQIQGAADAAVQANVDAAITLFIDADAGV